MSHNADRYRRFHCYVSVAEVLDAIDNNQFIAVAQHVPTNDFYVFIGKRKRSKKLSKLQCRNWEVVRGTHLCDVEVGDDLLAVEDVSIRDIDYSSCLILPFFHVAMENEQRVVESKFYIINEDHGEMASDGCFKMPQLQLTEKEDPTIHRVENNEHMMILANEICSDRNKCLEFLNRRVLPLEGLPYGKVTHFKYLRGIQTIDTSVWTVKYYLNEDCSGHARKQEALGYYELMNRLINN